MKAHIALLSACLLLAGCSSMMTYAPMQGYTHELKQLGPVKADSGKWPLSLHIPPPEYTFQLALRNAAAKAYGVKADDVILSEINVKFMSEMDGTIRSWEATATAALK